MDGCDDAKWMSFVKQLHKYDDVGGASPMFSVEDGESLLGECAFRPSYEEARELFRSSAATAGFSLESIVIYSDGKGRDYTTDVAILRGDPKRVLLHISGVHGVEGYAGSASQITALQYFALRNTTRRALYEAEGAEAPTVVLVHILNPFGMSHNRRVNEDNIDVNRNFLSNEQLETVRSRNPNFAGYVDVEFLLNPTYQIGTAMGPYGMWLSDLHGLLKVAYAVGAVGIESIKRSLVAGNYYKSSGLGFGGFSRSRSVEALSRIATDLNIDEASKVVLIDVHTGLGLPGIDTLVYFSGSRLAQFEKLFPKELSADGTTVVGGRKENGKGEGEGAAMSGYDLTVGTTDDFCREAMSPHLPEEDRVCVTQEFGTVPTVRVGKALMDENYGFLHGTETERIEYGRRLRACFFVETTPWARAVAHRGLQVLLQAFDSLVI